MKAGDWKSLIADTSLSSKDRQLKVKQFAKQIEDKAMRQEHSLRLKGLKPAASQRTIGHQHKRTMSAGGFIHDHTNHPMGKLNVSSVMAPSEAPSMLMASSPEQNDRKELDGRAFGTSGKKVKKVSLKRKDSRMSAFLSNAEQTEEVNELLIDAIKAKLAILDQMDD